MTIKKYGKTDFKTSTWSGGTTSEIFILPEGADYPSRKFTARISSAAVEIEKSEFTRLTGFQRFIAPLDGDLQLTHDNKNIFTLTPFVVYKFDGGINTTSFGKVHDFNLMLHSRADGFMKHWYSDKPVFLPVDITDTAWIFSYQYEGAIKLSCKSLPANAEHSVAVGNMELIILSGFEQKTMLKAFAEKKADFLYGIIRP